MFRRFSIIIAITITIGMLVACAAVYYVNENNKEVYLESYHQNIESQIDQYFGNLQADLLALNTVYKYFGETGEGLVSTTDANGESSTNSMTLEYILNDHFFGVNYAIISDETGEVKVDVGDAKQASITDHSQRVWLSDYEAHISIVTIQEVQYLLLESDESTRTIKNENNGYEHTELYALTELDIGGLEESLNEGNGEKEIVITQRVMTESEYANLEVINDQHSTLTNYIDILGTNYYVLVELPESVIGEVFELQRNSIIYIIVISAVSVCIILLILLAYISNRLGQITKMIQRMSNGEHEIFLNWHTLKGDNELGQLARSINKMSSDIKEHRIKIDNNYLEMVEVIINAVESNDAYTSKHNIEVGHYAKMLAEEVNYGRIDDIILAAKLHDIGKISIPGEILNKPGKLTAEEFEIIKTHPTEGHRIIENIDYFDDIKLGVKYHHEHWDGTGYPEGLKGDEIPLMAQIIAIADVYDAITSNRSYHDAMSYEKAESVIISGSGKHFNPLLVDGFKRRIEDFRDQYHKNDHRR